MKENRDLGRKGPKGRRRRGGGGQEGAEKSEVEVSLFVIIN